MKKIILDLSHWNNVKDWDKVKIQCDGIILKCGGSDTKDGHTYKDVCFEKYYNECKKRGIPVGCYFFGVGNNTFKGEWDAKAFYLLIKDKQFELPVYIDFEKGKNNEKYGNTDYVTSFCETMESLKYFVGIYASDISGFHDMLKIDRLKPYSWWVARYGTQPKYAIENKHMWQFSSTGRIDGIVGNVDKSECYVDFEKVIKRGGFNGF